MSYSPYPPPSTIKTRKPRPKPGPIKALGDINHYPSRHHPLPANISCRQICQNYPNHLRDEVLEDFIHWKWSARQIFDALLPDAQAQMSQNHAATNRNRNPSNVIAKRLEKRRSRYIRAGGLEQVMNRQNVRPHGMGPNWSGIQRDAKQEDKEDLEDTRMAVVAPITPASSAVGLANSAQVSGDGLGLSLVSDGVFQQSIPTQAVFAPNQPKFNGPVDPNYQPYGGLSSYQDSHHVNISRQPPAPVPPSYNQQPAYGGTYEGQGGGYGFDAPGHWNGDDDYLDTVPRGKPDPDGMYDDDVKWPINDDGIDSTLSGGDEYFDPTQTQPVQSDNGYQYPDPELGNHAASGYQQNIPYPYPMLPNQADHLPQVFDVYADLFPAPQAARYGYHYLDPAQDQENVNYRDLLDGEFNGYDGSANGNEHRVFKDDGFGGN